MIEKGKESGIQSPVSSEVEARRKAQGATDNYDEGLQVFANTSGSLC